MARPRHGCQASGEVAMEIGIVGLGRMGGNMTLRLLKRGHRVVAFDLSADAVKRHADQGAAGAHTWEALVGCFNERPGTLGFRAPPGEPTPQGVNELTPL